MPANTTYIYWVRAADSSTVGPASNPDIATTILFTDDPLMAGSTLRTLHMTELRFSVNAVRAAAGLPPAMFTDDPLAPGIFIKAIHLTELRSALDAARAAIGLPAMSYTDTSPTLGNGVSVKATHIREIRAGVQ